MTHFLNRSRWAAIVLVCLAAQFYSDIASAGTPPTVTALYPASVKAGNVATIEITGGGFVQGSVVQWSGASSQYLKTYFYSSRKLYAELTIGDVAVGRIATIKVINPGSLASNGMSFTVNNPVPKLHWAAPYQAYTGSGPFTLALQGSNFNAATKLLWNGQALKISTRTPSFLQATVPSMQTANAATASLKVVNPAPGGGSAKMSYAVVLQPPVIGSLSPGFAISGASDFTLTVNGVHFDPSAVVNWNGAALVTSFVSDTQLQATVPAADVTNAGVNSVTVINPPAAGGVSGQATFAVDPSGTFVVRVAQQTQDIAWDSVHFALYGTASTAASSNSSSIVILDPVAASIANTVTTNGDPSLLSMANDGEFLYVATEATDNTYSIQRLSLPSFTVDFSKNAGSDFYSTYTVTDMKVSPIYSHVVAAIYDDLALSPHNWGAKLLNDEIVSGVGSFANTWDTLGWSPDGLYLYGGNWEIDSRDLYVVKLRVQEQLHETDFGQAWTNDAMMVDEGNGLLYTDDIWTNNVDAIDPATGLIAGSFPVSGVKLPDSSLGCIFILYQTGTQTNTHDYTLGCYDPSLFTLTRSMVISNMDGYPSKILRWGNEGLAIETNTSVYFVSGQFVIGS
ncbi:MAG: IPT/TIG domain-containing protein [Bacillota bacterium]